LDNELLRAVNQGMANTQMDYVMIAFSILGLTIIWLAVAVPLWFRDKKRTALELAIMIIIIDLTVLVIKLLVARERPMDVRMVAPMWLSDIPGTVGYSFPSGHTARAFGAFLLLSISFRKRILIVPLFIYAFMIALSRIYLGMHYPSDVLAGAFIGLGLAYVFYRAARTTALSRFIDWLIKGVDRITSYALR